MATIAGWSSGAMQMRTFGINFSSIAVRNIAGEDEEKSVIAQGAIGVLPVLHKAQVALYQPGNDIYSWLL